jgi:hypothetical protein
MRFAIFPAPPETIAQIYKSEILGVGTAMWSLTSSLDYSPAC